MEKSKILSCIAQHPLLDSESIIQLTGLPKGEVLRCLVHLKNEKRIRKVNAVINQKDVEDADKKIIVRYKIIPTKQEVQQQLF